MLLLHENSIVKRVIEGDEKAFTTLYNHYYPLLYRFVIRILKSDDLAKDNCQEIFMKIWEDRERLFQINSFRYYLLTVGKNHCLNSLKKVYAEEKSLGSFVLQYSEGNRNLEDTMQDEEYNMFINTILETLPPQSRQVFTLCRREGLSYDEVSLKLGISRNVIKKHMIKSMRILRLAVERDLGIAFSALITLLFPS